jgi:PAS domain S-box-containing protein
MSAVINPRPKTLEAALRALEDVEEKLRARESEDTGILRLNANMKRSDERFRILAQGVPNHLLFLDGNLNIEFANDVFLAAAGWTAEKAVGIHISEVVGPERFLQRQQYYDRALAGETVEYEQQGAAGSEGGYFHFTYRPSFDEQGRVRGIFSMATDISARRRAELDLERKQAELLRSNKDLEQFAYVASHDLKAPLRAIDVLVQWITEGLEGYDKNGVQENLKLLGNRTARLNRLLDDLLVYSRAGRKVGTHKQTDTHALVLDVAQLVNPPPTITVSIDGKLPTMHTYATPLEQVFRNLISNAIKHHPGPEGRVVISCVEERDQYVFAVQDDGEGIPQQYAERVFEMFQTLKSRDQVEGSGMGLAIVNRIIQWQRGRIWFEPVPGGRGTIFKFQWKKNQPMPPKVEKEACETARQ